MARKSKLREKPRRVPDVFDARKRRAIDTYCREAAKDQGEQAKAQRFLLLLHDLFAEVAPRFVEDYLAGVEKYVRIKRKDLVVRGRVDAFYGDLVIEFERDLRRTTEDAWEQLARYVACFWSEEAHSRRDYLCVATDAIHWEVAAATTSVPPGTSVDPQDVRFGPRSSLSFAAMDPSDVYFWLDRLFLRQRPVEPTTQRFVEDFGAASPAFTLCANVLSRAWQQVAERSDFRVLYDNWDKYLRIAYGSSIASEELFIRHTYLATLAKLLAWARMTGQAAPVASADIAEVLKGSFFANRGLLNFLEEDFFSWVARSPADGPALELARKLANHLTSYNLSEISEDLLKELYQELVDPETRHDLGEYYTPDWLAALMVCRLLEPDSRARVLDPACGSGTFLYQAIRYKRQALGDSQATLTHIRDSVQGVDVHPLAVIVAKTNYLLALGPLLRQRRRFSIPVYLANSVRPPTEEREPRVSPAPAYWYPLDGKEAPFPRQLASDAARADAAIELVREFVSDPGTGQPLDPEAFSNLFRRRLPHATPSAEVLGTLFMLAQVMKELVDEGRDTIWAYVLKNVFKPLLLRQAFDVVVGNPPWLSYRFVGELDYQAFVKRLVTDTYHLLSGKPSLITHMELGTLFFLQCASLYLKTGGVIAFVLPRSVFTSDQHDAFRRSAYSAPLGFTEAWDLDQVKPLFKVPACVFFARAGGPKKYPIPYVRFAGRLPSKNVSVETAQQALAVTKGLAKVHRVGTRTFLAPPTELPPPGPPSTYGKRFAEGATIVPRPFWFVEVKADRGLGFDPSAPLVGTTATPQPSKPPWTNLVFQGAVEAEFLYATLLSTDLVPFGHLPVRMVVLPIRPTQMGYFLVEASRARQAGWLGLAAWLARCEQEWQTGRGPKSGRTDIYGWLDYRRKLSRQHPRRWVVLYGTSGTNLCGCVVDTKDPSADATGRPLRLAGFAAESTTYHHSTPTQAEAHFLAAILNSPLLDQLVKPLQSRGLWGERHLHKKLWEFPVPLFDPDDDTHTALAALAAQAATKVGKWLAHGAEPTHSLAHLRGTARSLVAEELHTIDDHVRRLLRLT